MVGGFPVVSSKKIVYGLITPNSSIWGLGSTLMRQLKYSGFAEQEHHLLRPLELDLKTILSIYLFEDGVGRWWSGA